MSVPFARNEPFDPPSFHRRREECIHTVVVAGHRNRLYWHKAMLSSMSGSLHGEKAFSRLFPLHETPEFGHCWMEKNAFTHS